MKDILKFTLLILSFPTSLVAQSLLPPIQNYQTVQYNAASKNWDMTINNDGELFVANNKGLLHFDGEKGWFDKRFMYEESFGTPLLMQLPSTIEPGIKIDAIVQNLDFAQTFLDLVGASEMGGEMQGESFKGLLEGTMNKNDFRNVIYYHYYDYPAFHMVKKHYGIRTDRYKLMHFYDDIDTWEFYDLEKDPKELINSIDDKAYSEMIKTMHLKLDSVQTHYGVTDNEFERAPKEKVDKAYKRFERLRGTPIK